MLGSSQLSGRKRVQVSSYYLLKYVALIPYSLSPLLKCRSQLKYLMMKRKRY